MKSLPHHLIVPIAFLGLGASCPPRFPTDRPLFSEPRELVAAVSGPTAKLKSLRALVRVDAYTDQGRFKVKDIVIVERPARLHIATLSPMDSPLSVLVSNGDRFALYDQREQKFFRGPSTPQNLAKLLPVLLTGAELVGLTLGEPPWGSCSADGEARRLFIDRDKGRYRIECGQTEGRAGGARDVIEIDPRYLVAIEARRYRSDGTLDHRIRLGGHERIAGALIPRRIQYEKPSQSIDLLIKVVDIEIDVAIEAGTFELEAPRGVPVVTLP